MPSATDVEALQSVIERAIRSAVPPHQQVERRSRPESEYSWMEPSPMAGLRAALTVVEIAQQQAYKHVRGLRAEGTPWREIADLLSIPWSDEYSRPERAYQLVLGPDPEGSSGFHQRSVYWHCRGPQGCGKYITDRGPYNGHPVDNEDGHADDCRRQVAEGEAYERERDEQEQRDLVADKAMTQLAGDAFGLETVRRARWVIGHGGQYGPWSTSEAIAVALVLGHNDQMEGYRTRKAAMERVGRNRAWFKLVRAAATGEIRG